MKILNKDKIQMFAEEFERENVSEMIDEEPSSPATHYGARKSSQ